VSDPILLFLAIDAVALLLLGACAAMLPLAGSTFLATMFSGLGTLLCLPSLILRAPETTLDLPIGPPGLSLHLALNPLSAFFLIIAFLAGTAIAAFQETTIPMPRTATVRITAICLSGTALSLLAADGVTLAIGLAIMCGAIYFPQSSRRIQIAALVPFLLLTATCLLTPSGFAPAFDAIRAAPVDPNHTSVAAALTFAAVIALNRGGSAERCWTRDALTAGVLIPSGSYLLLRLNADLAGAATQTGWGFVLLLAGGAIAVIEGWHAARHPDIDGSVACLARRQGGLAMAGIGLALIARAADLPAAEAFALAAAFLSAVGGSVAGVLASLSVHAIGASAGTRRLSRLGGLIHAMPASSAALAAGLLGLSAVPPGLGFASLWLMFEAILSAPRTGGLLFQLPLALIGAALALSAALATAASVRLIGIALLGRPRTPRGAGARETTSPSRTILLILATLSVLVGVLPGPALWLLGNPAIQALTGGPPGARIGLALLVPSSASPSYLALPVLALLALTTGAAMLIPRWSRKESKPAGLWADGMAPPVGLPFGEPAAQSIGEGFLPPLPDLQLPVLPKLAKFAPPRAPSATAGMWLILAAFGLLLLVLAVTG
jgi:formate hydrogenlyase subunit 3/multisubunit Na+/H+ antiporter MnhD subunit